MYKENIFDIKNTEDLPEDIKKNIRKIGDGREINEDTKRLMKLFDLKNPLSIDEIIVSLYRLHGIQKDRRWICYTINNWVTRGVFRPEKGKKGVYKKIK